MSVPDLARPPLPFVHCPGCGARGPAVEGGNHLRCTACGFEYFHNAAAAATALILCRDRVLLVRRGRDPQQGLLDLPGGFVGPDESLDAALIRELREELGLAVDPAALRYFGSHHNRYPYSGVTYYLCDAYFLLELASPEGLRAQDDVEDIQWWPLSDLPWEQIAFPTIRWALERLTRG
jgi:ADP-ribose pyrophosphatase YjhB (NUDIX family)